MTAPAKGLAALTAPEREVVRQCLHAAVAGPFIPDWEFHTLFGRERQEVAAVLARWPDVDDSRRDDLVAVNNSMNNLLGYPHKCEDRWSEFIDASWDEVKRVFLKWRGEAPRP